MPLRTIVVPCDFLWMKKPFYLERNFYYKDKKDILKNEADGEELSVVYGDLSMLLGGIDKETFGNTYDIPQTGAVTGKELADILSEYLSNAAEGGGANIQVQKAKAALTARKKELAQEVRIIHEQKNEDIRQFIVEKDLLERDARGLHANIADAEREINQLKRVRVEEIGEKRKRLSEQKRQQADRRERQENAPHKREIDGAMQPEKEHPDRMAGIGICASALLVNIAVHYVTSYPSRLFFYFAGSLFCRYDSLRTLCGNPLCGGTGKKRGIYVSTKERYRGCDAGNICRCRAKAGRAYAPQSQRVFV